MGYCNLDDVKRLLRVLETTGNIQHKIKFSNSYTVPEAYSSNGGTGVLKGITSTKSDYAGSERWRIKFTSSTAFTLYRGEDLNSPDGSGNISSNFTSTSGIITINSSEWAGAPQADDQFKFDTDSNVSDDDGDSFIDDGDKIIDGVLSEQIDSTYVPFKGRIPNLIIKASMYYAAPLIFTSAFSSLNRDEVPTMIRSWFNLAKNFVDLYLESIAGKSIKKYARYARFVGRESLFGKVGILETAGVEGLAGELEAVNVEYDEDYNTKESIGAT
jgi:hypothetical protein